MTFNFIKLVGKENDEYVIEFEDDKRNIVARLLQSYLDKKLSVDFELYKEMRNELSEI